MSILYSNFPIYLNIMMLQFQLFSYNSQSQFPAINYGTYMMGKEINGSGQCSDLV